MASGRARTFVKNLGPTRRLSYLPPNGRRLISGYTVEVPGILETQLFLGKNTQLNEYLQDLNAGLIEVTYDFSTETSSTSGGESELTSDLIQSRANKGEAPLTTVGDNAATGITLDDPPVQGSAIQVFMGGVEFKVGDGVKTEVLYFSNDGGSTAKSMDDVAQGDELYFNGVVADFDLAPTDEVSIWYLTAAASSSSSSP